jgi:hypothetical protein
LKGRIGIAEPGPHEPDPVRGTGRRVDVGHGLAGRILVASRDLSKGDRGEVTRRDERGTTRMAGDTFGGVA